MESYAELHHSLNSIQEVFPFIVRRIFHITLLFIVPGERWIHSDGNN